MKSSLATSEEIAAAVQKTPNRISLDDIKSRIQNICTVNLGEILDHHGSYTTPDQNSMTLCILTMDNGYTFIGKSAPADPKNYDPKVGEQFAYDDAVRQVWPMMGFEMKTFIMLGEEARPIDGNTNEG